SKDLRIWSAGCSTGEEPYTLAMLLTDHFNQSKPAWDTKVLATDISSKVLSQAKQGEYTVEELSTLPYQWREKYFAKLNASTSVVTKDIKNEVIFRKFNLMDATFPFKKKF